MKFSLKTMLIALCALGATVGIMGKLLLESPEVFLAVLRIASFAGPFLLAVGTIIWIGLRGKRSALAFWGGALMLIPFIVHFALLLLFPTGDPLRMLSTRRLIVNRLPSQVDAPWVWRELERRLADGDLASDEVEGAIEELVAHMKRVQPKGWNQPLAWQRDFLRTAIQSKRISEDLLFDLCDAFYGPQPRVQPIPVLAEGAVGFQVGIDYGSPWSENSNLGLELLWDVKQVSLDGKQIQLAQIHKLGENWTALYDGKLSPGDHVLSIEFDCVYIDAKALMGLGTSKAQLPVTQWPKARKRWKTTVAVPVKVESTVEEL